MFGFIKRKKSSDQNGPENTDQSTQNNGSESEAPEKLPDTPPKDQTEAPLPQAPGNPEASTEGVFSRLRKGLSKTGRNLTGGAASWILGRKVIDEELLEDLETRLLMADVGVEATTRIISDLTARINRKQLGDPNMLLAALHENMTAILQPVAKPLVTDTDKKPYVILMVGINGAGKTTTIGKLAKHLQNNGKSVLLAAGDTFRAAAVEQLQAWGVRNHIQVVAQGTGSDSASVIYDGLQAARARDIDVLIADTAGRLHTQTNLMDELSKVKRVMAKIDLEAPHEIMLVVDAGIGQNALVQAKEFNNALGLTGITVTKLDGTAKGGILFAIAQQTGIPIRFIGVGETLDDLRIFKADEFVSALLANPTNPEQ